MERLFFVGRNRPTSEASLRVAGLPLPSWVSVPLAPKRHCQGQLVADLS